MAESPKLPQERINFVSAFFLILVAIIFDAAQFLLLLIGVGAILDFFISLLADMIFGFWFIILDVRYFSGKKAGSKALVMLVSVITELVPIIDALPAITFGVAGVIYLTKKEDAEDKKKYEEWARKQESAPEINPKAKIDWYLQNRKSLPIEADEEELEGEEERELVS